jgi:hypothetical protein
MLHHPVPIQNFVEYITSVSGTRKLVLILVFKGLIHKLLTLKTVVLAQRDLSRLDDAAMTAVGHRRRHLSDGDGVW